jgi:hypothetical protein
LSKQPGPRYPTDSLLVFLAQSLVGLTRRASPYPFARGRLGKLLARNASHPSDQRRADIWAGDLYVLSLVAVSLGAWLLSGINPIINVVVLIYAVWRIVDVVTYQLGVLLVDVSTSGHGLASLSRSVLSSGLNIVEVIVLFAALEHILAPTGFVDPNRLPFGSSTPQTPGGWLYVSWTTLLTLGSTYAITTGPAKALVMAEVASGLLLIAVALSSFVGAIQLRQLISVDAIEPDHGTAGTLVLIRGSGFGSGTTAALGGLPIADLTVASSGDTMAGHVPTGPDGAVDLSIIRPDGFSTVRKGAFVYSDAHAAPGMTVSVD